MEDKIVTFESYYDPMLAHIVRTRLEYNNIPCFIADEYMIWARPYLNQALWGIKLKIFEKDLQTCREILATVPDMPQQNYFEIDNTNDGNNVCPVCSSNNIGRGVATNFKFHLPSLLVSLFFGAPVYFRMVWHCFNCGHEF